MNARWRDASLLACGLTTGVTGCATVPASTAGPAANCPEVAIVLSSQAEVARVAHCTRLPGVTIRSAAGLDVAALAALATIAGDLVIGPTVAMHDVSLAGLRLVEGSVRVAGNALVQRLQLPRLERAQQLSIESNAALTTILLPRLVAVRDGLRVTGNAGLELIDLSALASVGGELQLSGPQIAVVEAGSLRAAGRVELDAPRLPPELADQLHAAVSP